MIPNWTRVRVTEDVPCTYVKLGDEGIIIDKVCSINNKQFLLVEVSDKDEIATIPEDKLVNVEFSTTCYELNADITVKEGNIE